MAVFQALHLMLLFPWVAIANYPENSPKRNTAAIKEIESGDLQEAYRLFRVSLEDNPCRPSFWENYGMVLVMLAEKNPQQAPRLFYEAREVFEHGYRVNPDMKSGNNHFRHAKKRLKILDTTNLCGDENLVSCPYTKTARARRRLSTKYENDHESLANAVKKYCGSLHKISVHLPEAEVQRGRLGPMSLIAVFEIITLCGVVVLKDVFDTDYMDNTLKPATDVLIEEYLGKIKNDPKLTNVSMANQRSIGRYEVKFPLREPFSNHRLVANPSVLSTSNMMLGTHKFELDDYSHITSLSHTPQQHWHGDTAPLWQNRGLDTPPHGLISFVPLHDLDLEMGPTRFAVGTQWMKLYDSASEYPDWPVIDTTMDLGDCLVYDMRMLHAGGANKSDRKRTIVALSYVQEWFYDVVNFQAKQSKDFDKLDSYLQKLLTRQDHKNFLVRMEQELVNAGVAMETIESTYEFENSKSKTNFLKEEL